MSLPKFTPGPWHPEPSNFPRVRGRGCWWNVQANEDFVADCSRTLDPTDEELARDKANAYLVAAAPDLFFACLSGLEELAAQHLDDNCDGGCSPCCAMHSMILAIAKALDVDPADVLPAGEPASTCEPMTREEQKTEALEGRR